MQFKYPEILYALLLLIIPIIVHLFQLQRFVKVPFTNVAFLKNIEKQTRKSAKLKKWLVLISRLLALSCIILAFSQPYFSKSSTQQQVNISISSYYTILFIRLSLFITKTLCCVNYNFTIGKVSIVKKCTQFEWYEW